MFQRKSIHSDKDTKALAECVVQDAINFEKTDYPVDTCRHFTVYTTSRLLIEVLQELKLLANQQLLDDDDDDDDDDDGDYDGCKEPGIYFLKGASSGSLTIVSF